MAGADDEAVIDFARSERRLLVTEDKDFGQLVFAAAKENSGVILIRYPATARSALTAAILKLLSESGETTPYQWLMRGFESSLRDQKISIKSISYIFTLDFD